MKNIPFINSEQINNSLNFSQLIEKLQDAFRDSHITTPVRHHHHYKGVVEGDQSTLLLMPSWEETKNLGIKIVTVSPENGKQNLPAVQGLYILLDTKNGKPLALFEGNELTLWRTAATSALASQKLSRIDSKTLLMVGTGSLAPYLIKAHTTVRSIEKVLIWGRNISKAKKLAETLTSLSAAVEVVDSISEAVPMADIISCATLSKKPLIMGEQVKEGQHIDLVGSYLPDMRESDDKLIQRASIYIDTETALKESGDLVIPLHNNLISETDIKGNLHNLCSNQYRFKRNPADTTLFKSVGHASEDLVTASLLWEKLRKH